VRISFDSLLDSKSRAPPGLMNALQSKSGPDGVALIGEFQFVKPGKGMAFVRAIWHLELRTKVRSRVVARWMLDQFAGLDVTLLYRGVDYRSNEDALARLIEDESSVLPDGPFPGPSEDEGGVGGRVLP